MPLYRLKYHLLQICSNWLTSWKTIKHYVDLLLQENRFAKVKNFKLSKRSCPHPLAFQAFKRAICLLF